MTYKSWEFWILLISIIVFGLAPVVSPNTFSWMKKLFVKKATTKEKEIVLNEIRVSIKKLSEIGKGATFIIDKQNDVSNYISDSVKIDAQISSELLINIFEGDKSPLHDGAIIIHNGKIKSAAAYITKLSDKKLPKNFGTRHRSGIGITEQSNAIAIILSEETGQIIVSHKGDWSIVEQNELATKVSEIW